MKYYIIQWSLSAKEMGYLPQVKKNIYPCHIDSPEFMEKFLFRKIDITPCIPFPVIDPRSYPTDLIQAGSMGFSSNLLISDNLKKILQDYFDNGMQLFKTSVFWNGIESKDYWLLHPYCFKNDYIDYGQSKIIRRIDAIIPVQIFINTKDDFENVLIDVKKKLEIITIENVVLQDCFESDFFSLLYLEGGSQFIVSEKLKCKIEEATCTGIQFQPIELSFNEWTKQGGERERIYGKMR